MYKKILILALGLLIFTGCSNGGEKLGEKTNFLSTEDISKENLKTVDDLEDEKSEEIRKDEKENNDKNEENKKVNQNTKDIDPILAELSGKSLAYRHPSYRFYHGIDFLENGHFRSEYSSTTRDMEKELDLVQKCIIEGEFVVEEKLDDTAYTLRLVNPKIVSNTGEVVSEEGREIRYVDNIGGFDLGESTGNFQDLYTLYLPGRDKNAMTDTLKGRLSSLVMEFQRDTLPCFMLVNNSSTDPFMEADFIE